MAPRGAIRRSILLTSVTGAMAATVAASATPARADGIDPLAYAETACGTDGVRDAEVGAPDGSWSTSDERLAAEMKSEPTPPRVKLGKTVRGGPADYSGIYWCVTRATAGKRDALTVSSLGVEDAGAGGDLGRDLMVMWARPVSNAAVAKLVKAGSPPRVAVASGDDDPATTQVARRLLADRKALVAALHDRAIVAGSAPGEVWQGKAAAKVLAGWKLDFAIDGPVSSNSRDTFDRSRIAWVVANVTATPRAGGAPTTYRLAVGLLAEKALPEDEAARADAVIPATSWRVVLLHFAVMGMPAPR